MNSQKGLGRSEYNVDANQIVRQVKKKARRGTGEPFYRTRKDRKERTTGLCWVVKYV